MSFNAATNTYSGELINNKYSDAEWYSRELDACQAQDYYQQLLNARKK